MLETGTILFVAFGYMALLFAIAYWADKRADQGRSVISNPYIYALSLAVYCTAWTFYGSVGRAVQTGPGFLTIYIGPTLTAALGWLVLRKILRISKVHRITSIADFIASRYGKSMVLGGVVTIIAVLGIIPYIALQLKAISTTFLLIRSYPEIRVPGHFETITFLGDTAFYVALLLAVFAILFGTRHLDATERHEGLVAAIAFESIVKLMAFVAVGVFVTYGMYNGLGDIMARAATRDELRNLFTLSNEPGTYINWSLYIFLSMLAFMFLPRQFQVTVVENVNEDHLDRAVWLFPLYLLVINIFVLPVAFGGLMHFSNGVLDADTFVLSLPMAAHEQGLALFVFIGGMSAATGMVIVETIALSTMICNDLFMPVMVHFNFPGIRQGDDLSRILLNVRRGSIVGVLLLGYGYFHFIGEFYALVSIGLVSFTAVAQFAPAILLGIFWKRGTGSGALSGLLAGIGVWAYTLVLPSLVQPGLISESFVTNGPMNIELLKPFSLFGMEGFDRISHAVFWSLLANAGAYIGVSLYSRPSVIEHSQAALFVDVFRYSGDTEKSSIWRGTASVRELRSLLSRFLGNQRTDEILTEYEDRHLLMWDDESTADPELVSYCEKLLAGVIGSASARVLVASVEKEEPLSVEEVMEILDETRQVILSSRELERATEELRAANERLRELDRLKNEFISTITHELRTPLTSVRALAEILYDTSGLDESKRRQFSGIIVRESERLTRLINQILDFQKIESGRMELQMGEVNLRSIVNDAVTATGQLIQDSNIELTLDFPEKVPSVIGDRDRLVQVMVNLISNAVKFCDLQNGQINVSMHQQGDYLQTDVKDNGEGISLADQEIIFDEFRQIKTWKRGRPAGTGLGLTITKRIIDFHGGKIWVSSRAGEGAMFSFTLPLTGKSDAYKTCLGI